MLTAEHVRTRKKAGELIVRRLDAKERERAVELGAAYLSIARAHVGRTRDELGEAWADVPFQPKERRLAEGLQKLVEDVSELSVAAETDPVELRRDLFSAASAARAASDEGCFDRAAVLDAVAKARNVTVADVERALYSDLKGEQIVMSVEPTAPESLVERFDRGQVQAVLLRAVRVVAEVRCSVPAAYRALFRELKFRRLLYRVERHGAGYRIEIDGPFSLFESVTRYGLALALLLPALEECDSLALVAEVRWGKQREPLVFRHLVAQASAPRPLAGAVTRPGIRDDVSELAQGFAALQSPWRVEESDEILDVPGIGICVPDLVFTHGKRGERVYFEALGFWSRDAVWKRVELAKGGLGRRILFAVSSRLRVSEAVLADDGVAGLYVYKGVMSARSVERKLSELIER